MCVHDALELQLANQNEKNQAVWGWGTALSSSDEIICEESPPALWGQFHQAGPALSGFHSLPLQRHRLSQLLEFPSMALRQGAESCVGR